MTSNETWRDITATSYDPARVIESHSEDVVLEVEERFGFSRGWTPEKEEIIQIAMEARLKAILAMFYQKTVEYRDQVSRPMSSAERERLEITVLNAKRLKEAALDKAIKMRTDPVGALNVRRFRSIK